MDLSGSALTWAGSEYKKGQTTEHKARQANQIVVPACFVCAGLSALCAKTQGHFGQVLSVNSQAVYLKHGSALVCLALPQGGNMFYGALVKEAHWSALQTLSVDTKVYCQDGSLFFESSEVCLNLNSAPLWKAVPVKEVRGAAARRLGDEINILLAKSLDEPALALGQTLSGKAKAASGLFYAQRFAEASAVMQSMLGLGFGLTPSGDDYCLGMLAVFNMLRPSAYAARVNKLSSFLESIEQGRTTPVSAWFLKLALGGVFAERVQNVLLKTEQQAPQAIGQACEALLQVGASSGRDILRGMAIALHLAAERRAN